MEGEFTNFCRQYYELLLQLEKLCMVSFKPAFVLFIKNSLRATILLLIPCGIRGF